MLTLSCAAPEASARGEAGGGCGADRASLGDAGLPLVNAADAAASDVCSMPDTKACCACGAAMRMHAPLQQRGGGRRCCGGVRALG
ncbi:hypothetical protein EON67_06700 [archaeon]|nr:MAG: hypothetical protein EON67_06700 [archaeon]